MTHRIVPAEPTWEMQIEGRDFFEDEEISTDDAEYCYRAMLSAAPPFEWPEEAVEAAAKKMHDLRRRNNHRYQTDWFYWSKLPKYEKEGFMLEARAALNAALKVLEGRDA